jgi:hypothetical protein
VKSEHLRFLAALFAAVVIWFSYSSAQAVTLEWEANSETNVAGYRVYTGRQSRVYDSVLDVGNQTLAQLATTPGTTYYAVTAYDTEGLESDFSDEVSYTAPKPNSAPLTRADQYVTTENGPLNISASAGVLANDSDPDGDTLSVFLASPAIHGTLSLNGNGSFSYTPALDFAGTDSFSYRATDGRATSAVAVVTITVTPAANSTPIAQPDQYVTTMNVRLNVLAAGGVLPNDSDADGDSLIALLVSSVGHGTLSFSGNGGFSYAPGLNFMGTDSFSYRVTDGRATSDVAVVTIIVSPSPNNPPVPQPDQYATARNAPLTVSITQGVLANDSDADGDTLVAVLESSTVHGTLALNPNGSFNYVPGSDFTGTDSFSYRATDGKDTSAAAIVTINVSTNFAPSAQPDHYVTTKNVPLTVSMTKGVLSNDSDLDGDGLAALLVSSVTNGTLSLNPNGSFVYTLALDFVGTDSFSYCATDGKATSAVTVVTITVNSSANAAPTAQSDSYITARNTPINLPDDQGVLANDFDAEGDPLLALLVTSTAHGTLSLNTNGSFSYIPALNFIGIDSFSYRATDGKGTSVVATVTLAVNPSANLPPIAYADQYLSTKNVSLQVSAAAGVLANDFDGEDDPLAVSLVGPASHGAVSLNTDGSFAYTPAFNFTGADFFSYCVTDGKATSALAVVTIVINEGSPGSLACWDCFAAVDAVLVARSNAFPAVYAARMGVPTNTTCPQSAVFVFDTLRRSLKGIPDAEIQNAFISAGDCLAANLKGELLERLGLAAGLSASRWTTTASNQIAATWRNLDRLLTTTNNTLRGQILASATSSTLRIDRLIAAGDLAPTALTNRRIISKITGGGSSPVEFIFGTDSFVVTQTNDGTPVSTGTYAYVRTAWNRATLVLSFDREIFGHATGELLTVQLNYSRTRGRITGALRGYFTFE